MMKVSNDSPGHRIFSRGSRIIILFFTAVDFPGGSTDQ